MRRTNPVFLIVTLNLALLGWTAAAAVPPAFFSSPAGKDIQRGSGVADECSLLIRTSTAAYESCVTAAQDRNHGKGGDPRSFDTGLFFSAWQQIDGIARPEWPPKSKEDTQIMAYSKPLAVRYLKLYRKAQKKAGVSDEQVITVTGLNPDMFETRLAAADHGY